MLQVVPLSIVKQLKTVLIKFETFQKSTMSKFAPNYVKTLLNMYRGRELEAAAMATAREFVALTPTSKCVEFYSVALGKARNDPDEALRPVYWDIVVLLAPWIPATELAELFSEAIEMTKASGATSQKKGWRILEQVGGSTNETCATLMREKEPLIMESMMSSLGTCAPSARKPRLQLLEQILPKMTSENLNALISELVMCTKDKNTISRALAYDNLGGICARFAGQGSILEFIQVLLQGLNGSPLTVACTLNVVTRIMYEFRTDIPAAVHGMILENVLILMNSAAREILKVRILGSYPLT